MISKPFNKLVIAFSAAVLILLTIFILSQRQDGKLCDPFSQQLYTPVESEFGSHTDWHPVTPGVIYELDISGKQFEIWLGELSMGAGAGRLTLNTRDMDSDAPPPLTQILNYVPMGTTHTHYHEYDIHFTTHMICGEVVAYLRTPPGTEVTKVIQ